MTICIEVQSPITDIHMSQPLSLKSNRVPSIILGTHGKSKFDRSAIALPARPWFGESPTRKGSRLHALCPSDARIDPRRFLGRLPVAGGFPPRARQSRRPSMPLRGLKPGLAAGIVHCHRARCQLLLPFWTAQPSVWVRSGQIQQALNHRPQAHRTSPYDPGLSAHSEDCRFAHFQGPASQVGIVMSFAS